VFTLPPVIEVTDPVYFHKLVTLCCVY